MPLPPLPISVAIVGRGRPAWLWRALAGVRMQTRAPSEIVVVDESSGAEIASVARAFHARVVPAQPGSVGAARNLAIEAAAHEWVALLSCNALWDPRKLERQWEALASCPHAGLILTNYTTLDAFGGASRSGWARSEVTLGSAGLDARALAGRLLHSGLPEHPSALVNRALWRAVGGYDEKLTELEDAEFFLRLIARAPALIVDDLLSTVILTDGTGRLRRMAVGTRAIAARVKRNPERYPALPLEGVAWEYAARASLQRIDRGVRRRIAQRWPSAEPGPQSWDGPLVIGRREADLLGRSSGEVADPRYVALTFDDGPDPVTTPVLLETLRRLDVPATFFALGVSARANPSLCRRLTAAGMELAQHAMSHAPLPSLHAELEAHEIAEGRRAVEEAGGAEVRYFRPPYGAYDERTIAAALTSRQEIVGWNVSAEDWRDGDPSRIARRVIAAARPVSIVLLHDGYRATIEALPQIVASYREAGYRFVTVGELLRSAA